LCVGCGLAEHENVFVPTLIHQVVEVQCMGPSLQSRPEVVIRLTYEEGKDDGGHPSLRGIRSC
jgi:hypothetical protein